MVESTLAARGLHDLADLDGWSNGHLVMRVL